MFNVEVRSKTRVECRIPDEIVLQTRTCQWRLLREEVYLDEFGVPFSCRPYGLHVVSVKQGEQQREIYTDFVLE